MPIGWDPKSSPLGIRVNLGNGRLRADNNFRYTASNGSFATPNDAQIWQGVLDAKLSLPIGRALGATSNLYAVGGGGAYCFRNYGYGTGASAATSGTTGSTTSAPGYSPGTTGTTTSAPGYAASTPGYTSADRQTRFGANVGGGLS